MSRARPTPAASRSAAPSIPKAGATDKGARARGAAPGESPCPCGLPATYTDCCGRWHTGPLRGQAPDAQALMRSRYCAFALGDVGYLRDTWHPSTRPADLSLDPAVRWLGLQVQDHQRQDEDHATVRFIARSKQAGRAHRLVETSRFVREDGRWLYVDGDLAD